MLLNADTGEVIPFSSYTVPLSGKWKIRRPLTLSESTLPLYLEFPLIPGGIVVRKRAGVTTPSPHHVGLQPNIEAVPPPPPPQQSV